MAESPSFTIPVTFLLILQLIATAESYDPFDPNGSITIKWDVMQLTDTGYIATVDVTNYQTYRHVEKPGWRLQWDWPGEEVIWDIRGAEATEQGNCTKFKGDLPHCCLKRPIVVDLLPGAPYNFQVRNCCKAGILSAPPQNLLNSAASFSVNVGNTQFDEGQGIPLPSNFDLGLRGYTCGEVSNYPPSKFPSPDKRRWTQALQTWKVTCSYSQFLASQTPGCCVSLSTFYSRTIVECPHCSCGCQDGPRKVDCLGSGVETPHKPLPKDSGDNPSPFLRCTGHMCPVQIHWHVKVSYRGYWRLKVTLTNYNLMHNYSEWNLVIHHPNFASLTQVFSFEHFALENYGPTNDTVMFWGIPYYNDVLLQYGENGNVQTEMILRKKDGEFTFHAGWTFPRRVIFNGDECIMPPPELYPKLPNSCSLPGAVTFYLIIFLFLFYLLSSIS